jgi:hypothetical protein
MTEDRDAQPPLTASTPERNVGESSPATEADTTATARKDPLRRSRTSGIYVGVIILAIILIC